jgi:hypothetical protein
MDASLKIRKHLTPSRGMRASVGAPDMRREVRREVSERVTLKEAGQRGVVCDGWTLNVSRGGVRVIVERQVDLGAVFEITVGLADASPLVRHGRVVWFQQEADGYIAGIAFLATPLSQ